MILTIKVNGEPRTAFVQVSQDINQERILRFTKLNGDVSVKVSTIDENNKSKGETKGKTEIDSDIEEDEDLNEIIEDAIIGIKLFS